MEPVAPPGVLAPEADLMAEPAVDASAFSAHYREHVESNGVARSVAPKLKGVDDALCEIAFEQMLHKAIIDSVLSARADSAVCPVEQRAVLPVLDAAFETEALCEPGPDDELCPMMDKCEIVLMAESTLSRAEARLLGFVGKGMRLPGECADGDASLCLVCRRKQTAQWYYDRLWTGREAPFLLQSYQNKVDQPGEYALSSCILPWNGRFLGIAAPIVLHDRAKYRFSTLPNGKRLLAQQDVYFRQASAATPPPGGEPSGAASLCSS